MSNKQENSINDDDETKNENQEIKPKDEQNYIALGVSIGTSLGVVLGFTLFDNIGVGIGVGLSIGVAIGSVLQGNADKKDE